MMETGKSHLSCYRLFLVKAALSLLLLLLPSIALHQRMGLKLLY